MSWRKRSSQAGASVPGASSLADSSSWKRCSLGHVVGQLLLATRGGLLQRRLDLLHALHQQGIALGEGLDRGAEGLGQAGDLGGAGGHLGAGFLKLPAARLHLLLEAGAGALEQGGGGLDQRFQRGALLAGGAVHAFQQLAEHGHVLAALLQQGGVAGQAFGQLAAHLGDDLG